MTSGQHRVCLDGQDSFGDDSPFLTCVSDNYSFWRKCYPELPFILRETDQNSPLYRHISDHISDPAASGKELDVQGIIDLAIWKDGTWVIVDYKTDRIKSGESKAQFLQRLRDEYTPQIASYAQVLERLGQGSVTHCYLCSIPLKGELIELTLN